MRHEPPNPVSQEASLAQRLQKVEARLQIVEGAKTPTASVMYRAAAQNLSHGVFTLINVDTSVLIGPGDLTNHYYVCPTAGIYMVNGTIACNFGAVAASFLACIFQNGSEGLRGTRLKIAAVGLHNVSVGGLMAANAGERFELRAYQDSGAEQALEVTSVQNRISVFRVS